MDTPQGIHFATIDVGSNAVRLMIASVKLFNEELFIKKMNLVRLPIRLGEDVFNDGEIHKAKRKAIVHAMKGFRSIMKAYEVEGYMACATSAFRDASNGGEIIKEIKESTGIKLEIINGKQEASYIFEAGLQEKLHKKHNYLYVDVGGGSTELTLLIDGKRKMAESFQIGTVRFLQGKVKKEEWQRLFEWLDENASGEVIDGVIGSGGNISKLQKLSTGKRREYLSRTDLDKIYKNLKELSYEERMVKFFLKHDRADVIVPAAEIFLRIMNHLDAEEILVPRLGLTDGLLVHLINDYLEKMKSSK